MKQEFEIPSGSPVAIPYKWEAAPGRPILKAVSEVEPSTSPLRPPPGARNATKPLVSRFDGFEPEPQVLAETQLAGKVLKKLNRLRRKSIIAGACFTSEASRIVQHSGRLFAMEDLKRCHIDSDAPRRGAVTSTPHYSTPIDSTFCEPLSRSINSSAAVPFSPFSTGARPSSHCFAVKDGTCPEEGHESGGDKTLPGPGECAWHEPHGEAVPITCVPRGCRMRRSSSNLDSTFLPHSTSSHSFKPLTFVRTFRKSKAAKQLDFGT